MITIVNPPDTLNVGQSYQLTVDPVQDVTWLSSDDRVAVVTIEGVVEARTIGSVSISALNVNGDIDEVMIRVVSAEEVSHLRILPQRVTLKVGQTLPLSLQMTPSDANVETLTWVSSQPSIFSINGTVLTALRPGTSVITVSASNGVTASMRAECLPSEDNDEDTPCSTEKVPINKTWLKTDRIYSQYRNKPKAVKWFNITREIGTSLYEAIQDVRSMYNIDLMIGEQLDIIGRVLGIDRVFNYNADVTQAMYAPNNTGSMFGDPESMYASGSILMEGLMSDDLFRLVLKAKIIRNNNGSDYTTILHTFKVLFPQLHNVYIVDYEDMSYNIFYVAELTDLQRWALLNIDLLPKPPGVMFSGFIGIPSKYVQAGDDSYQLGDLDAQLASAMVD